MGNQDYLLWNSLSEGHLIELTTLRCFFALKILKDIHRRKWVTNAVRPGPHREGLPVSTKPFKLVNVVNPKQHDNENMHSETEVIGKQYWFYSDLGLSK